MPTVAPSVKGFVGAPDLAGERRALKRRVAVAESCSFIGGGLEIYVRQALTRSLGTCVGVTQYGSKKRTGCAIRPIAQELKAEGRTALKQYVGDVFLRGSDSLKRQATPNVPKQAVES